MRELQVKMVNRYGERKHNSGAAANGKIDHAFSQGSTGDCWLLAGIKSIANNPQAKKILEDCIQVDKNGDVTVTLKGPGKTYKITKSELLGRKELSSGDLDVRAIEIAVERYQQDYPNKKIYGVLGKRDNLEGNTSNRAFQLLLGTSNYEDYFGGFGLAKDALITKTDSIIDKAQKGDSLIQVARSHFDKKNRYAINEHGKKVRVENDHAYSVTGADDKYVYFVNPWDTGETLKQTHQEFKDTFRSTGVVSMKEVFEKEDKRRYKNGVNINA